MSFYWFLYFVCKSTVRVSSYNEVEGSRLLEIAVKAEISIMPPSFLLYFLALCFPSFQLPFTFSLSLSHPVISPSSDFSLIALTPSPAHLHTRPLIPSPYFLTRFLDLFLPPLTYLLSPSLSRSLSSPVLFISSLFSHFLTSASSLLLLLFLFHPFPLSLSFPHLLTHSWSHSLIFSVLVWPLFPLLAGLRVSSLVIFALLSLCVDAVISLFYYVFFLLHVFLGSYYFFFFLFCPPLSSPSPPLPPPFSLFFLSCFYIFHRFHSFLRRVW